MANTKATGVAFADPNFDSLQVGTALNVPQPTASQVAGLSLQAATTGGTVALTATDTGSNTNLGLYPKGTGLLLLDTPLQKFTPAAVNATATVTAAQAASGYITSTSASPTTMTLPTGTLLGAALGATQGTVFDLYIDNTAGASTVTIAVAVNGILSAAAAAGSGAGAGLLTVPSGVTGQAKFTLMFSSATAYTFSRTA